MRRAAVRATHQRSLALERGAEGAVQVPPALYLRVTRLPHGEGAMAWLGAGTWGALGAAFCPWVEASWPHRSG